jgi:type III restriction enzyme
MAFELKLYQERCLKELGDYLRRAAVVGAKAAFVEQIERPYRSVAALPGLPYVCVRVPTGGGKTVLAAHGVGVAAREWLRTDLCLVLWLAPTNAIVQQTLKALRDRRHPYRLALDSAFGGNVEVMSLSEALYLTRATLDGAATVVVSTLQAMRVEETEGRKVYETSGALQAHFSGLEEAQIKQLERTEDGVLLYSLANVMRLRRPLVIVDEAHNARTLLSFETLKRFAPSCIIEFTATPDEKENPSNVLCSVSAAELKAEQMVKLPIRLVSRTQWKEAVATAIGKQRQLEQVAKDEETAGGDYLRPIVLLQAQPKSQVQQTITVEVLRNCLREEFGVPDEQIAEGTGQRWELPDNLLGRDCPIRFVLTVAALREGWDCPFAYVLCSVSNLSSRSAVEQILGRVLRLPNARAKQHAELNYAYAYATSERFYDAANALADALVDSGFQRYEAPAFIEPDPALPFGDSPGPLFAPAPVTEPVSAAPRWELLPPGLKERIKVSQATPERPEVMLVYAGPPLGNAEKTALQTAFESEDDKLAVERLARKSRGQAAYPAALGLLLAVPQLAVRVGDQLQLFEDQFREAPWSLAERDACLSEGEFSISAGGQAATVDVDEAGKVRIEQIEFLRELREQLSFHDLRAPRTPAELAVWLDRSIYHPDVTQTEMSLFLRRMVDRLISDRGIALEQLAPSRFRLRDAAEEKVSRHRHDALNEGYQRFLSLDCETPLEVSPEICFRFPAHNYPAPRLYEGPFRPRKHYYEHPAEMNDEEVECAAILDALPQVKYWARNLTRHDCAFWLPTASDKFYPDFVALLHDGRFLVVEYKGRKFLDSQDTREKRIIGEIWEARSRGRCLFRLVSSDDMRDELQRAVSSASGTDGGRTGTA